MKKPWIIAALGVVASASLLLGGLALGWWSHADGDLRTFVGLRDAQLCRDGACAAVSLRDLGGTRDLGWIRTGLGAYAAAWMGGILCLALAGMAAAGKGSRLLARTTLVAVLSAAVVGILFLVQAPVYVSGSPGPGMLLYFGGALAGAVAVALARREFSGAGGRPSSGP